MTYWDTIVQDSLGFPVLPEIMFQARQTNFDPFQQIMANRIFNLDFELVCITMPDSHI